MYTRSMSNAAKKITYTATRDGKLIYEGPSYDEMQRAMMNDVLKRGHNIGQYWEAKP